jgi:hypothetical protein
LLFVFIFVLWFIVCDLGFVHWSFEQRSVHALEQRDSIAWGMDLEKGKSSGAGGHSNIWLSGRSFLSRKSASRQREVIFAVVGKVFYVFPTAGNQAVQATFSPAWTVRTPSEI